MNYEVAQISPTDEFYGLLSLAFDHFNKALFSAALPHCLLTVQRETNTMGYFSPDRWGNRLGEKAHEIAINPAYFASHSLVEVLQTLVHEQCHLWQQVYGARKSRQGYHNREWAWRMEGIGLMPSQSGLPGGKKTGQQMSDYPVSGGPFLEACQRLVENGFQLSWIDRIPASNESSQIRVETEFLSEHHIESEIRAVLHTKIDALVPDLKPVELVLEEKLRKNKSKYSCPGCETNIWGKPKLRVTCERCNESFIQIS
ncbi:MAG: putative SprT family Zn-dependent metalloprotease [Planctomycetota bacterium]|jgi:predicted SprT family Zn-dependent metalloprotease